MKIIISPAKKMKTESDFLAAKQLPEFLDRAEMLRDFLRALPFAELKQLLCCNEQIARLNYERFQSMTLHDAQTPAIFAYEGIQYQYMAPSVFTEREFAYVEDHLRILSGFYGLLHPFDGVTPYRLEMQAKLKTDFCNGLYDFWKDDIYRHLLKDESVIVNLASDEYSKAIRPFIGKDVRFITAVFGESINGKIREKGVYVKMARGEMVRFMAEHGVSEPEEMKEFDRLGYRFSTEDSTDERFVYIKE